MRQNKAAHKAAVRLDEVRTLLVARVLDVGLEVRVQLVHEGFMLRVEVPAMLVAFDHLPRKQEVDPPATQHVAIRITRGDISAEKFARFRLTLAARCFKNGACVVRYPFDRVRVRFHCCILFTWLKKAHSGRNTPTGPGSRIMSSRSAISCASASLSNHTVIKKVPSRFQISNACTSARGSRSSISLLMQTDQISCFRADHPPSEPR